jgi:hypothetical protein
MISFQKKCFTDQSQTVLNLTHLLSCWVPKHSNYCIAIDLIHDHSSFYAMHFRQERCVRITIYTIDENTFSPQKKLHKAVTSSLGVCYNLRYITSTTKI